MENEERKFYLVGAKNISSENDKIKDVLIVICEEVNGVLEEILTSKKVCYTNNQNALLFDTREFFENNYSLLGSFKFSIDKRQISTLLTFMTEDRKREIISMILSLEKLTMETMKERLKSVQELERKIAATFRNDKILNKDYVNENEMYKTIPYYEYLIDDQKHI